MIGIAVEEHEKNAAEEFFQLFKTPWEYYQEGRIYDCILTTSHWERNDNTVVLIYSADEHVSCADIGITGPTAYHGTNMRFKDQTVTLYGNALTFEDAGTPLLFHEDATGIIAGKLTKGKTAYYRIGFNIFEEVRHLLTEGQEISSALVPTLEIHIAILRHIMLQEGIPVLEIPPVPAGYLCITCLTHDVDFISIRQHFFTRSIFGFLYRAAWATLKNVSKGKIPFSRLLRNWTAVITLPLVQARILGDYWFSFKRYFNIDREHGSTFFVMPFKSKPGEHVPGTMTSYRATRYDVDDLAVTIRNADPARYEFGVHGIDAWHDPESGKKELERIADKTGQSEVGIRMHWLLFNNESFQNLDKAGYSYDSTFGYNETPGFRGGTTQVFRPFNTENILELPMHIQDTALFYPKRLNLSEQKAWKLCGKIIKYYLEYGGVLTILWHQRSLAPERLWGSFYQKLIDEMVAHQSWFGTARDVTGWFRHRRSMQFEAVTFKDTSLEVRVTGTATDTLPPVQLRLTLPSDDKTGTPRVISVPWSGEKNNSIDLT